MKKLLKGKYFFALTLIFLIAGMFIPTMGTDETPTVDYTLESILNKYNVFSFGDVSGVHIVGPVIAGGDLYRATAISSDKVVTISPDNGFIFSDYHAGVSSYIQGRIYPNSRPGAGYEPAFVPKQYIGTANSYEVRAGNDVYINGYEFPYIYGSQYRGIEQTDTLIDWEQALLSIQSQASDLLNASTRHITLDDVMDRLEHSNPVKVVYVQDGEYVTIDDDVLDEINYFVLVCDDLATDSNIVINIGRSGSFDMPGVRVSDSTDDIGINVATPDYSTDGQGTGVVFNIPNASTLTFPNNSGNGLGHLIAPQADVYNLQGTYTGCQIVKNFYSTSEGHMFPYNASLTLDPNIVAVVVNKVWDGTPQSSATINLYANDVIIDTVELNADNNWKHIFGGLDKFDADGKLIDYSIGENKILGYKPTITENSDLNFTITNTETDTTLVKVSKVWIGTEKESVTINLLANGVLEDSVILTKDTNWTHTFDNLPILDENDQEIEYSLEEVSIDGYTSMESGDIVNGVIFTNTEVTSVDVEKKWVGTPGTSATVNLLANDEIYATITLDATNEWKHTFKDLPVKLTNDSNPIEYKIQEVEMDGYHPTYGGNITSGVIITNTEVTSIDVEKVWVGTPGTTAIINLYADDVLKGTVELNDSNDWTHSFKNLPVYREDGINKIDYQIQEVKMDGYLSVITGDKNSGFVVTNTEVTSIDVDKKWVGTPGTSATINLLADGELYATITLDATNEWKYTFKDLPVRQSDGKTEVSYTIQEVNIDGYHPTYSGNIANGITITNTEVTSVDVEKKWVGTPGTSATINLLADGGIYATITLNATNEWKHTFDLLPVRQSDGETAIVYTIQEVNIDGYKPSYNGNATDGYVVTNTEVTSIDVEKKWIGTQGTHATMNLLADNIIYATVTLDSTNNWKHTFKDLPVKNTEGVNVVYSVQEDNTTGYTPSYGGNATEGFVVTNIELIAFDVVKEWKGTPGTSATVYLETNDVKGTAIVLNEENGWTHSFTQLPKYDSSYKEIKYKIIEDQIDGYKTNVSGNTTDGFVVTNTEITSVDVEKVWIGTPGASVTVELLADGVLIDNVTLNASNGWTHTFEELTAKRADHTTPIEYTVKEIEIDGYVSKITGNQTNGYIITNTEVISFDVTKEWVGTKEDQAVIYLVTNNVKGPAIILNEANSWKYSFKDLPVKDASGKTIDYKIEEDFIPGYTTIINGSVNDGFVVKNTNSLATSVAVSKVWIGAAGDLVTVELYADGVKVDTAHLTSDNGWKHTFYELPKVNLSTGKNIKYEVKEIALDGYTGSMSGNADDGFVFTNTNITKRDVHVNKEWIGKGLDSVTVYLYADGVKVDEVVLNAQTEWKHTFTNLLQYNATTGKLIDYTVAEEDLTHYSADITGNMNDGYTITNTNTEVWVAGISKEWFGPKGASATVHLFADGVKIQTAILNESNGWTMSFENLYKYDQVTGKEIIYTVEEEALDNYESSYSGDIENGFVVLNINTEIVKIDVSKQWVGPMLDQVVIYLTADGDIMSSVELSALNNWSATFDNLQKYHENGDVIVYDVVEESYLNYTSERTGNLNDGFVFTNTNEETISLDVSKEWIGPKQSEATIYLYADGEMVNTVVLSETNEWKHTWTSLPKYNHDGSLIVYTVDEKAMNHYETTIKGNSETGFVVTNRRVETRDISVDKIWVGDKQDSITVSLLANGVTTQVVKITEQDKWHYEFVNLPKYDQLGKEIVYTISENPITHYTSEITGNQNAGFVITNTQKAVVSFSIEKVWYGPKTSSVTIDLFANGQVVQTYSLGEFNQWKVQVNDLPVYDSLNQEIIYTVKERPMDLYESEVYGDAQTGFIVENIHFSVLGSEGSDDVIDAPETSDSNYQLLFGYTTMMVSLAGMWVLRKKII